MPTLIAKSRLKFGSKATVSPRDGRVETLVRGTSVMPGETFEADAETSKQFLLDGTAVTQADARAETRDTMSAEQKLREAEEEARAAGLDVTVSIGAGSPNRESAVHRENQAEEEAAVAEATKAQKADAKKGAR